jgi:hypothetical protein
VVGAERRALAVRSSHKTRALLSSPGISDTWVRRVRVLDNWRSRRNAVAETLAIGLVEATSSSAKVKESTSEEKDSSTTDGDTSDGASRERLLATSATRVIFITVIGGRFRCCSSGS